MFSWKRINLKQINELLFLFFKKLKFFLNFLPQFIYLIFKILFAVKKFKQLKSYKRWNKTK